jgi:hypothetical protein
MKNFQKILILFFFLCLNFLANAQVSVNLSQLSGTKWKVITPCDSKIKHRWTFSSSERKSYMYYGSRRSAGVTYTFYLDSVNSYAFDNSKIGVSVNGCYIHEYNTKINDSGVWQIESFDEEQGTMTLTGNIKVRKNTITKGGNVTLVLKRIP